MGGATDTTVAGSQTSPTTAPAGAEVTTTVVPGEVAAPNSTGDEESIGTPGDPVQMEPTEACPSGTYVEILGLLVCSEP